MRAKVAAPASRRVLGGGVLEGPRLPGKPFSRSPRRLSNLSRLGFSRIMSWAAASVAVMGVPRSSWLPQQWSPSACVLTSRRIGACSVSGAIAASIRRVRRRSHNVSIRSDSPEPTISPAFDSPRPPFG